MLRERGIFPFIILLAVLLAMAGCAETGTRVEATQAPQATMAPTPEPVPETVVVPDPDAAEAEETFFACLAGIPQAYDAAEDYAGLQLSAASGFLDLLQARTGLDAVDAALYADAGKRCVEAAEQVGERFPDSLIHYDVSGENCGWKYIGPLLALQDGHLTAEDVYGISMTVSWEDDILTMHIAVEPVAFQPLLYRLSDGDRDAYMHARFLMSYLTTVYDEAGEEKEYVQPALNEDYVESMGKPLKSTTFWDRWYQGRSDNTRKHTGLDMHAGRNAKIFSCTDGTVLFHGYDETAGYYVIILDDQGYEYHYYHMIRESTFLEEGQRVGKGDLIGRVGNTGNSSVYHLHLALITPDGEYVRLYDIMKEKYGFR